MLSIFRRGFGTIGRATGSLPRRGLEEFIDPNRPPHQKPVHGRAWTADELRRKSFDDLHKLWYVLYKERNVLMTEELQQKKNRMSFMSPLRKRMVRKSMARIKVVLKERQMAENAAKQQAATEEEAAKEKSTNA